MRCAWYCRKWRLGDLERVSRYNHVLHVDGRLYLTNALRRGVHEIEQRVADALGQLSIRDPEWENNLSEDILSTLRGSGYVVEDGFDEWEEVLRQREQLQRSKTNMSLTIAPTMDCNFGCPYCFEGQGKGRLRMSSSTAAALVQFVESRATEETKKLDVTWFGGEPLLGLRQIEEITSLLKSEWLEPAGIAYEASIITNGYGLTRKVATRLREQNVTTAQVTLDGTAEYHDARRYLKVNHGGTFARIMHNISEACDLLQIVIRVNLDRSNQESYTDLVSLLREKGLSDKVGIYPAFVTDSEDTPWEDSYCGLSEYVDVQAKLYVEVPELGPSIFPLPRATRLFCGAQSEMFWVIAPNGDLHKCWSTINDPTVAVGSVFTGVDSEAVAYWHGWGVGNPTCDDCGFAPLCMGGCAYQGLVKNGPQCQVSQQSLEHSVRALAASRRGGETKEREIYHKEVAPL